MIIPQGFPSIPNSFEYDTEVLQSTDGEHGIFFNWFKKKNTTPKRALLMIHGQGEHGGRYQHFVHFLQDHYDVFLAPDLRGHGRSEGIRGHVDSFDEYSDDALLAFETLKSRLPPNAIIDWFGHSMGGTVTLRSVSYRANLPVRNFILSAPCVGLTVKVPLVKDLAAKLLANVWGSLQMETGLNPAVLSHDPAVTNAILKDQLHHKKATSRFYLGFMDAMAKLREARDFRFPADSRVLFQLAGDDKIVSTEDAKEFFSHLNHVKKKEIIYPGLYHEIYNEISKEAVFQDLTEWLDQKD